MILAWHNEPTLKAAALQRLREHRRLDEIVQGGGYWRDGRGCHLGCLVHRNSAGLGGEPHSSVERLFGIPVEVAFWLELVFENLPRNRCANWVVESAEAIPIGADLHALGRLSDSHLLKGCPWNSYWETRGFFVTVAERSLALFRSAPVISAAPAISPEVRQELCARNLWCDGPVAVHRECVQAGGRV